MADILGIRWMVKKKIMNKWITSSCRTTLHYVALFVTVVQIMFWDKMLYKIQKGQNYSQNICPTFIYRFVYRKGHFFFFFVFWAAGVFSCDRQQLDMKGTANSKYDLINYICQWFPADLSPALHILPLSQPTSQPVSQEIFCWGLDNLPGFCS